MINRLIRLIALVSALLLAGCADTIEQTEFAEISPSVYPISGSSDDTDNGGSVRVELIRQAQEFCDDRDRKFRLVESRFEDGNDDKSATATIDFACELPSTDGEDEE